MGDIVVLRENFISPSHWSIGCVEVVHPGPGEFVRVVTVKTVKGTNKRPITKLTILMSSEEQGHSVISV